MDTYVHHPASRADGLRKQVAQVSGQVLSTDKLINRRMAKCIQYTRINGRISEDGLLEFVGEPVPTKKGGFNNHLCAVS